MVEKPQQVFLWFSEEPELRLTELTLLDPTGHKLADLAPRPAPGDPRAVTANVPDIQPGTYTISNLIGSEAAGANVLWISEREVKATDLSVAMKRPFTLSNERDPNVKCEIIERPLPICRK